MINQSLLLYLTFLPVGLLSAITPGPSVLLLIAESSIYGIKKTQFLMMGLITGSIFFALIAVFGVMRLIADHPQFLQILRYVGVMALCYFGIKKLYGTRKFSTAIKTISKQWKFNLGMFTTLANPKIGIFYLIIIPQFIASSSIAPTLQYALLAVTQIILKSFVFIAYAYIASHNKFAIDQFMSVLIREKILGVIYIIAAGLVLWVG